MPCIESEAMNLEVLVLRRGVHRFATAKLKDKSYLPEQKSVMLHNVLLGLLSLDADRLVKCPLLSVIC